MRIDIVSIEVYAVFMLIVNVRCDSTQRIVIRREESFTFDCQQDESVYFARRLGDWSEVQEDNENYHYLNLKFTYLNQEKIQRVTCNTAQSENVGYYGCRKPTWTSTTMTRIYQLILADVQSFYWTYVCHGPAGSCVRADDSQDESRSTFEVADQTKVDLFCCAAVNGYKHIEMKMNSLGDRRDNVEVNRKEELDGTWVICANQHTQFQRISARNKQTLKCELIVDDRSYSTLSSDIDIKDAMPVDPDMDIPFVDETPSRESPNKDNDYFHRRRPSASGKLTTGKRIALIVSSIIGGLVLCGVFFSLILCLCWKKKALTNSQKTNSKQYSSVHTHDTSNKSYEQKSKEVEESVYVEPTPLYMNSPVVFRL